MTTFYLPDLGEGLREAEIVAWHIKEGDMVQVDQPMVSVETAKAVVEVPSPYNGKVARLLAKPGQTVDTHQAIVEFDLGNETGISDATAIDAHSVAVTEPDAGSMTVVGRMNVSNHELVEHATAGGMPSHSLQRRLRAAPAVRMLARRLKVDLAHIKPTGKHGLLTVDDLLNYANLSRHGEGPQFRMPALGERLAGPFEPVQGARRFMAQAMAQSRDQVAAVTVFDDVDIHAWQGKTDVTARVIRAMCRAVKVEPALNAVFDPNGPARRVFTHVDLGIAIDEGDKLFVPVIRDAQNKSLTELRAELNRLKTATRERTLAIEEMRDYTITLTNFGSLAGRHATPLVVPPTVAILGTGKVHRDVVAVGDAIEIHPRIPLSVSFDHRCITGGEAVRFLGAVIKDLELAD